MATSPISPPVYPILFSNDTLYQREHFSVNHRIIRGDTYVRGFTVQQDGSAFNLTSCTLKLTAKYNYEDSDASAVFQLSSPSSGITIVTAASGTAKFTISPSNTSLLPLRKVDLVYDIQLKDSSNNIYTIAYGKITVVPNVTTGGIKTNLSVKTLTFTIPTYTVTTS